MANFCVAFGDFKGVTPEHMKEGKVKLSFKHFTTHRIFDIKMDGKFTRKAKFVAGGHKMSPP